MYKLLSNCQSSKYTATHKKHKNYSTFCAGDFLFAPSHFFLFELVCACFGTRVLFLFEFPAFGGGGNLIAGTLDIILISIIKRIFASFLSFFFKDLFALTEMPTEQKTTLIKVKFRFEIVQIFNVPIIVKNQNTMFAELRVSEELLKVKRKLSMEMNTAELEKLWWADGQKIKRKEVALIIAFFYILKGYTTFLHLENTHSQQNIVFSIFCNSTGWVFRQTPSITDCYKIGQVLGNPGQYGLVREATDKSTKEKWAVKIVSKRRFQDKKLTASFFEDLRAEAYLMAMASGHPFIIELKHVFEDINNLYFVMSRCCGGELFDRIQVDESFSERKAAYYMRQMMSAVYYIHSLGIVHCDLKPENFLLRSRGKDSKLALIDFVLKFHFLNVLDKVFLRLYNKLPLSILKKRRVNCYEKCPL
ncbi:hypothetical protein RFI_13750 [Reticulomyxa filosa]|uniref:Protein kinase domain-containing protein n=1 Tax=Reticulomyxa filosa TaxID=46433 RepID=X6NBR8_RETFI|nr:hypothetical protein RFI_13750 [Reticulomyxa filosa]|eukprot:ETO23431.1 hypothetical protein RFI_13750 [Reticulomyxa filosa]